MFVGCCLATKSLNLNNMKYYGMGGGDSGCGIGLLGVTSNKLVTFPRRLGNVTIMCVCVCVCGGGVGGGGCVCGCRWVGGCECEWVGGWVGV